MARIPGRKKVRRLLRPLVRMLNPGAVVIGYHRVANVAWDPLDMAVSAENFAAQVGILRDLRQLVTVCELAERKAARGTLADCAALTFDDGYRDFVETALPIAERLGARATVFVATGFAGRAFWWDEIAALLAPNGGHSRGLEIATKQRTKRYFGLDCRAARAAAANDLCRDLIGSGEDDIRSVIDQLQAWAGDAPRADGIALTAAQLTEIAQHRLVEIGAHTISHVPLGRLDPEAQSEEIRRSKQSLETLIRRPVNAFSYPYGSCGRTTPSQVQSAGFACACMSRDGLFGARSDRYRIPRIWAPNVPGPEFRRWLANWIPEGR